MTDPLAHLRAALAGRYDVVREIGQGAMAVVYLARDEKHARQVALKVLRAELVSTLAGTRFLREIRFEARLQHPHILPLYDSGSIGNLVYYVMPYVEGESLRERLTRTGPLSLSSALAITRGVASALACAHQEGIVHRDVKPENILLKDDHALLADFGIARAVAVAGGDRLTRSGIAIGTPAYMSPEQAGGEAQVDGRSDIYALGCVLFEMLAGEPPFVGRTARAIIARHMQERAPSLEVVRPGVPPSVQHTVTRALAKVPADRFATAEDFLVSLDTEPPSSAPGPTEARRRGLRRAVLVAATLLLAGGAFATWRVLAPAEPQLDGRRIVGFPLVEVGTERLPEEIGETVALGMGSALEAAAPLRWIDGWTWLSSEERQDIRTLTARSANRIARARGARYHLAGQIVERGDSAHVIVQLYDLATRSVTARRTVSGLAARDSVVRLGLDAVTQVLPALLEPGHAVDLSGLLDRDPSAVALLMLGNREYREARFAPALSYYERAVARDSALALAALRGAPVASWLERTELAKAFAELAITQEDHLPPRYGQFARGLKMYLLGQADSAVMWLRSALALRAEPGWADAWMTLGEVYRHLLPETAELGSSSGSQMEAAFRAARAADPEFHPALFHLIEIALWRGDVEAADGLVREFARSNPDSSTLRQLRLMIDCAGHGPDTAAWDRAVEVDPNAILEAGYSLMPSPRFGRCARATFRTVLGSKQAGQVTRWNALVGLQSLLFAAGMEDSLRTVLDSAIAAGMGAANGLYVVAAIAGADLRERAAEFLGRFDRDYASKGGPLLWLLGEWAAYRGDGDAVTGIAQALERKASKADSRQNRLFADIMEAHAALARGDSVRALLLLERLRPTAPRPQLTWSLWEPLAPERLLLARLLLAAGRFEDAERQAASLDRPAPAIYRLFQPRAVELRRRIASDRRDRFLARKFEQ